MMSIYRTVILLYLFIYVSDVNLHDRNTICPMMSWKCVNVTLHDWIKQRTRNQHGRYGKTILIVAKIDVGRGPSGHRARPGGRSRAGSRLCARSLGKARLSAELEGDDASAVQHQRKVGCSQDSEQPRPACRCMRRLTTVACSCNPIFFLIHENRIPWPQPDNFSYYYQHAGLSRCDRQVLFR